MGELPSAIPGLWQFIVGGRAAGTMRFEADGTIGGYAHPNEAGWRLAGDELQLLHVSGRVTAVLRSASPDLSEGFTGTSLVVAKVELEVRPFRWDDRGRPDTLTRVALAAGIEAHGWSVGDHTYGAPQVLERGELSIGRFCSIAGGVIIALGNHRIDAASSYPFATLSRWWPSAAGLSDHDSKGPVIIGNDVWIGTRAFIGSGVRIGDGAVIAAHAVVTKDVPPYAIVGGNPARVIRHRFSDRAVERMLALRWWEWDDDRIDGALPAMLGGEVETFLDLAEAGRL